MENLINISLTLRMKYRLLYPVLSMENLIHRKKIFEAQIFGLQDNRYNFKCKINEPRKQYSANPFLVLFLGCQVVYKLVWKIQLVATSNYAKLSKFFPESIFLALCFSSGERHSSSTYNKVGLFLKDKGEFCPKIKYVLEG